MGKTVDRFEIKDGFFVVTVSGTSENRKQLEDQARRVWNQVATQPRRTAPHAPRSTGYFLRVAPAKGAGPARGRKA